jgi:WD40 repeat protein
MRRGTWLVALAALLLVAAGGGTALWLHDGGGQPGEEADGRSGGNREASDTSALPACSDEDDPKYYDPLDFGPPIQVPFDRRPLDALARRPLPVEEVYPWQPEGLVAVLGEHRMRGSAFAVSPDGSLLAVAAGDVYVRIGGVDTLHEKHVLTCPANAGPLAWSPGGETLAVGCGGEVRLFGVRDPSRAPAPVALEQPAAAVHTLAYSADGKYLLGGDGTAKGGTAWVWDVSTRKVVSRLKHTGPVTGVAFSPVPGDYRALTGGGPEDGQLHLWNALDDQKEIAVVDFTGPKPDTTTSLGAVAISPDGKRALSCHPDGTTRLWDLERFEKGKEVLTLAGHAGGPLAQFSPDGAFVATARLGDGGVYLWNARDGKQVRRLATSGGVYSLRFLPGGGRLVFAGTVGSDTNIHIHEVETGKEVRPPLGHLAAATCVALGPAGGVVASGGGDQVIRLWDAGEGRQRHAVGAGGVWGVGFHPDGKRVWFTSASLGTLGFLDAESGQPRTPSYQQQHSGAIYSADVTADGRYAVTGGYSDGTVRMWRLEDGKQVRSFDAGMGQGAIRVKVAPDMRRAIRVGGAKTLLVHLRCLQVKHEWDAVSWAPFLPDGRAVFGGADKAPVWKIAAEKVEQVGEFPLDLRGLTQGHLSADGKRVAAVVGGRAAAFDLESGRQLWAWTPPPPFGGVRGVALSPDGGHLLSANGDGTVYVVRLP